MAEKIITIAGSITVNELADKLNLPVTRLVGELFKNGVMATINQRIDFDTATIIVEELDLSDVELRKKTALSNIKETYQLSDKAIARPPIIAMMGHVDHGKTSLLDAILKTKVVSSEAGGITQHISAYQTKHNGRVMTLLDTPGHEAFAAIRQHGAELTDVVIIVVAADDGVKPQTVEAIKFARSANAKIIVAINKIDKDTADPTKVKTQLATEHGLNPEEWGGDTVMVEVSAKTGQNIDKLLDMALLVSDLEDLKADVDVPSKGLVIEAHMEAGRGPVVGLLVKQGGLKVGAFLVAGVSYGKIRTMLNYRGDKIRNATPSTPVSVTGFKSLPQFGDTFTAVKTEKEARTLIAKRKVELERDEASTNITGNDLLTMINQKHESKDFNIIIKADVQGSLISLIDTLKTINTGGEVKVNIVGSGVGDVSENDIRLALDDNTIIYGFNVNLSASIKRLAVRNNISVRLFKIIYQLLDDAKEEMEKLLAPKVEEKIIGRLKIKGVFRTTRNEIIAGGEVIKGKIIPDTLARVIRGKDTLAEVEVVSVQREKQNAKEVFEGEICGLSLKTPKKIKIVEGDELEIFTRDIIKQHIG